MSSSHAASVPPPSWPDVARHLFPVFLMGLAMTVLYLTGFHRPEPHHVPIAVVAGTEQGDRAAAALTSRLGSRADVRTVASQEEADAALRRLEVSGAVAPVEGGVQLSVARAASDTSASVVTQMVQRALAPDGAALRVRDVAPLPEDDPVGQNTFFTLVVLSVSSYSLAIGIAAVAARRRLRERLLAALVASVVVTAVMLTITVGALGMYQGHAAAVAGIAWLLSAGIMLVGLGTHMLVGRFTTFVMATTFVALSFTSSGGVFESTLQPHLFGWLHDFWIGSGFVQALTRVLYFPELSVWGPVRTLLGWAVLGALLVVAGWLVERRSTAAASPASASPRTSALPARPRTDADRLAEEELELEEDVAV